MGFVPIAFGVVNSGRGSSPKAALVLACMALERGKRTFLGWIIHPSISSHLEFLNYK